MQHKSENPWQQQFLTEKKQISNLWRKPNERKESYNPDEYDVSDVRHGHVRHEFLRGKISEDSVCGMDCVK